MNKNVSWSRLIFVWLGVILLTFAAYRLVRIQTYDLQQDVMIQQDLLLDEGMFETISNTTLISNDNISEIRESLGPIPISDRSALKKAVNLFFRYLTRTSMNNLSING